MGHEILIVDDALYIGEGLSFVLTRMGLTCHIAEDGQKALDLLQSKTVDLIITDLHMPNLDGLSATRIIRSDPRYKDIPIIAYTGFADGAHRREAIAAGVNEVLVKPMSPEEIAGILKKYLG